MGNPCRLCGSDETRLDDIGFIICAVCKVRPTDLPEPRPLTAAEVTEPGWYWWRRSDGPWTMARITRDDGDLLFVTEDDEVCMPHIPGTFIGPLQPPVT